MKATEQYFPVVLLIMLYKVVLNLKSVDEVLMCDHSNESYRAVLSCGAVYYAVQGASNFGVWIKLSSVTIQLEVVEKALLRCCLFFVVVQDESCDIYVLSSLNIIAIKLVYLLPLVVAKVRKVDLSESACLFSDHLVILFFVSLFFFFLL